MQCYSPAHVQTFNIKILLIFEAFCLTEKYKKFKKQKQTKKKPKNKTTRKKKTKKTPMKSLFIYSMLRKLIVKEKVQCRKQVLL